MQILDEKIQKINIDIPGLAIYRDEYQGWIFI